MRTGRLTRIGDGVGLVIDGQTLEAIGLAEGSAVDVQVQGDSLIIRRVKDETAFRQALERTIRNHDEPLRKLAE